MKTYMFVVTLIDTGLPYPDEESAMKDCREWAEEMSQTEGCEIALIEVKCEDDDKVAA